MADIDEKEATMIEDLAEKAEYSLMEEESRKDLKERRGIIKQTLYDGPKKLKHIVPKGKRI